MKVLNLNLAEHIFKNHFNLCLTIHKKYATCPYQAPWLLCILGGWQLA